MARHKLTMTLACNFMRYLRAEGGRILEQSAAEACSNLAGQLHRALGELDAVIKDVRTAVGHRQPGPEA